MSRKKSGDIVISKFREAAWKALADCTTPKELFDFVKGFDLRATKKEIEKHFA